ncbi:hypothetical protein Tco_1103019 [Tanacetum coccineum]
MENEHELGYETLTRVYLGSYEHYKGVVAEVEHSKPGFELQGAKMVEMGRFGIIREQRIAAYKGYRGGGNMGDDCGESKGLVSETYGARWKVDGGGFGYLSVRGLIDKKKVHVPLNSDSERSSRWNDEADPRA